MIEGDDDRGSDGGIDNDAMLLEESGGDLGEDGGLHLATERGGGGGARRLEFFEDEAGNRGPDGEAGLYKDDSHRAEADAAAMGSFLAEGGYLRHPGGFEAMEYGGGRSSVYEGPHDSGHERVGGGPGGYQWEHQRRQPRFSTQLGNSGKGEEETLLPGLDVQQAMESVGDGGVSAAGSGAVWRGGDSAATTAVRRGAAAVARRIMMTMSPSEDSLGRPWQREGRTSPHGNTRGLAGDESAEDEEDDSGGGRWGGRRGEVRVSVGRGGSIGIRRFDLGSEDPQDDDEVM